MASADPNIRNSKSWTAVQSASANGHFEAVLRLVQHGASWRNKADCDVIKTLCRKSTFKYDHSLHKLDFARSFWKIFARLSIIIDMLNHSLDCIH